MDHRWMIVCIQCLIGINCLNIPSIDAQDENNLERSKRFVIWDKQRPNKEFQPCTTSTGMKGHCKYIQYCHLGSDVEQKYKNTLENLCIIQTGAVGVCCPDDIIRFEPNEPIIIPNLPATGDTPEIQPMQETRMNKISYQRGCGISTYEDKSDPKRKIQRETWPWMAALMSDDFMSFCGGALITEKHVLTAAHCTYIYLPDQFTVRLGDYDFDDDNETRHRTFGVARMTLHEEYDDTNYDNDIAILELNRTTIFNSYIWPICLPPVGRTFEMLTAVVAGWGAKEFAQMGTNILMEVNIPVWPQKLCRRALLQRVSDKIICAAGYKGNADSCQGDSGGPLMYRLENGRWVNIGIVSWGVKCGLPGRPGIYTRTNSYLDWIAQNI